MSRSRPEASPAPERSRRWPFPAVVGFFLLVHLAMPASAQPAGGGVEERLSQIDSSLREIVLVLSRIDERQEADLILRRIELESRKVEALENQLSGPRAQLRTLEDAFDERFVP